MSDHGNLLIKALKDVKLTSDEWTVISKACDQCLPSPLPPNTGLPPSSFVLTSQALTSNPAATEAIKKHILDTQKSDKPAELPAIYRALMSYRY